MKYSEDDISSFLEEKDIVKVNSSDNFTNKVIKLYEESNTERPFFNYVLAAIILFSLVTTYKFTNIFYSDEIDYSDISSSYSTSLPESYYLSYGYEE